MSTPRVSVIMPVYNAECFVRAAVESILAQTLADFELILIDDGSSDDSLQMVREIHDSRLRILQNEKNLGAAATKNRGIENARGEFIAFLDADDIALPQRLAAQLDFLQRRNEIGIVGSQFLLIDECGREMGTSSTWPCEPDDVRVTLLFENCIVQSAVMLRREILATAHFRTELEPAEDYDLWARLKPSVRFANLNDVLVKYRVNPSGISARSQEKMESAVRAIHAAQIAEFRLAATSRQVGIHRCLSRWPFPPTRGMLEQAEGWLSALKMANATVGVYPTDLFGREISRRWESVCEDSWPLGIWSWLAYWRSPLSNLVHTSLARHLRWLRRAFPASLKRGAPQSATHP